MTDSSVYDAVRTQVYIHDSIRVFTKALGKDKNKEKSAENDKADGVVAVVQQEDTSEGWVRAKKETKNP